MATLAGLQYATGEAVIVMDVDLQDPPELLTEMVAKWRQGYDVVYAQRRGREGETWLKRIVAGAGYRLINKIADVNIPPNTGDFRLMSRRVVDQIVSMKESHGFLRGMVALVGFRQTSVIFDRPPRFEGTGHYNRFFRFVPYRFQRNLLLFELRPYVKHDFRLHHRRFFVLAHGDLPFLQADGMANSLGQPIPRDSGFFPRWHPTHQRRDPGRVY